MKSKRLAWIVFLFLLGISVRAQDYSLFEKERFAKDGETLLYRMLDPKDIEANKKYPLVLFLHGAGERGNDNNKQLTHGAQLFLKANNRENHAAWVVFPQCPKDDYWSNVAITKDKSGVRNFNFSPEGEPTQSMLLVLGLMDSLVSLPTIDQSKIYVGGLSMGGMGTFEIVKRRPDLFAAATPICGGGNPDDVSVYANNVAFWIFHGAKDNIVNPLHSKQMYQALIAEGADVKFTLYPEANHNSWDPAFAEPAFMSWLFSKSK